MFSDGRKVMSYSIGRKQNILALLSLALLVTCFWAKSKIPGANSRPHTHDEKAPGDREPLDQAAQQQRLIENIYQRSQPFESNAVRHLDSQAFTEDIALRDTKYSSDATKWIWDFFPRNYNCPLKERFGRQARIGDGGKWECGVETLLQRQGCMVYSFGSNGDTDFEEAVLATTNCEVHVFDPTLGQAAFEKLAKQPKIQFHPIGLGPRNEQVQMHDNTMTMGNNNGHTMDVLTLQTIMQSLNHNWVDVLKIDIEGFEYAVLQQLMENSKSRLPVTQLLVEFHYWDHVQRTLPQDILATFKALVNNNFRVFSTEPNWWWTNKAHEFIEYSFLHVDDSGKVLLPRQEDKRDMTKMLVDSM